MVARPSANGCHLKLKPFLAESHPHILGEGAVEDAHHCTLHSTHMVSLFCNPAIWGRGRQDLYSSDYLGLYVSDLYSF